MLAFVLLAVLSACGTASSESTDAPGGGGGFEGGDEDGAADEPPGAPDPTDDHSGGDSAGFCQFDEDCEAAAATCCECPTFALPVTDGYSAACEDVECAPPQPGAACAPTRPSCLGGTCQLVCEPVACDVTCDFGFLPDAAGCLGCSPAACAPSPPAVDECVDDSDCVEVPADCCGCENGGSNTAVAAERVDEHIEGLGCEADPICPGVNVCSPDAAPACVGGTCMLATTTAGDDPSPGGPAVCGTPVLVCPPDLVCVLNDPGAEDASQRGLGVCRSP